MGTKFTIYLRECGKGILCLRCLAGSRLNVFLLVQRGSSVPARQEGYHRHLRLNKL